MASAMATFSSLPAELRKEFRSNSTPPNTAHICHEAREETAKTYDLTFGVPQSTPKRLDFARDALYITDEALERMPAEILERVQRLKHFRYTGAMAIKLHWKVISRRSARAGPDLSHALSTDSKNKDILTHTVPQLKMALFSIICTASGDEKALRTVCNQRPKSKIFTRKSRIYHLRDTRVIAQMAKTRPATQRKTLRSALRSARESLSSSRSHRLRSPPEALGAGLDSLQISSGTSQTLSPSRVQKKHGKAGKSGTKIGGRVLSLFHHPGRKEKAQSLEPKATWDNTSGPKPVYTEYDLLTFEPWWYCRIENQLATKLLQQGEESASRTIYNALQSRFPHACFETWDDPTHVAWGRDDMHEMLENGCPKLIQIFNGEEMAGRACIMNVADLRNARAHPYSWGKKIFVRTTAHVYNWPGHALKLAMILRDDKEAKIVRKARQNLLQAALGTWNELKALSKAVSKGRNPPATPSKALLRTFADTESGSALSYDKQGLTPREIQVMKQELHETADDARKAAKPKW